MKSIEINRGQSLLVDDADFEQMVSGDRWIAYQDGSTFYAHRRINLPSGGRAWVKAHTFLTGWSLVDHRNGDGLDNRRANLRQATVSENAQNRRPQVGRSSRYKGVNWDRQSRKWRAQIKRDGQYRALGRYHDEVEAAAAYDAAALELFGEFARPNFPNGAQR